MGPVLAQTAAVRDAVVQDMKLLLTTNPVEPATVLTVTASYLATQALEAAGTFQAFVTATSRSAEMIARGIEQNDVKVAVTFLQRFKQPPANQDVDYLVQTVEMFQDAYVKRRPLTVLGQTFVASGPVDVDPIYDPKLLDELLLFACVLSMTMSCWN